MARGLDALLTKDEQSSVVAEIKRAEARTSGEIKVHIEARCSSGDAYRRAAELFERLGLTRTEARNAVLIYLAVDDRKFALIGDTGIHAAVGATFWSDVAQVMRDEFKRGAFAEGLVKAISLVGERLERHFPHLADDKNEIGDEISTDDN